MLTLLWSQKRVTKGTIKLFIQRSYVSGTHLMGNIHTYQKEKNNKKQKKTLKSGRQLGPPLCREMLGTSTPIRENREFAKI